MSKVGVTLDNFFKKKVDKMSVEEKSTLNHIFIDGSYFVFFRFFALKLWIKMASLEDLVDYSNICEDKEYMTKFEKTFLEKIKEIPKRLNLDKKDEVKIYWGKDCRQEDIWRTELFPRYKSGRDDTDHEAVGQLFSHVYNDFRDDITEPLDNSLLAKAGISHVLYKNHLEADDVIALTIKKLKAFNKENKSDLIKHNYYVITSDADYLQLADTDVRLFDLKYEELTKKKSCTGNAKQDLFIKCACGDKSDAIPSIFPKCGKITAMKLFELDEVEREVYIRKKGAWQRYQLNCTLIDFNNIPKQLKDEFYEKYAFMFRKS